MVLLALPGLLAGQAPDKSLRTKGERPEKTAGSPRWQVLTINNLWTWHRSDGEGNHSPRGMDGVFFPKFTGHCVYEDNIVFGGKLYLGSFPENGGTPPSSQPIRINGGTYLSNHGMDEGWVEGFGSTAVPVDKSNPDARIYRIRRDYYSLTAAELAAEASIYYEWSGHESEAANQQIFDQYALDWQQWPVERGAPYVERNGIPGYQAPPPFGPSFTVDSLTLGNYDEPGLAGENQDHPADQVIFTVYNGLRPARTLDFVASYPLGIEIQKTVWAYMASTSLGYHYFTRYKVLNKGGVDIGGGQMGAFYLDSLFLCQWSDPDVGNAGDDLAGCDSMLSLGFAYNGNTADNNYANFNLPPPSVGYLFLAGPLVDGLPSDSGISDFKRVYGMKNLPMSSFAYFSAGTPWQDPPFLDYDLSSGRWWKMLRGFAPTGGMSTPDEPYNHPPGYPITKFPLSGDPAAGTGFLDGLGETYSFAPGDRRILVNTGPFRLAPGDTAEIITGVVVGIGSDNISSVQVMKANSRFAQEALESTFDIPAAPSKPSPKASGLDREIILNWGENRASVEATEKKVMIGGYRFEGYNIYQLPSRGAQISEGLKIATFDIANSITTIRNNVFKPEYAQYVSEIVQEGTDNGIQYSAKIAEDYLEGKKTGRYTLLYNGKEYYFGITAYNYTDNDTMDIRSFESDPAIVTVVPQIPFGIIPQTSFGDTLSVTHVSGPADIAVHAHVVDPTRNTGDTYEIRFDTSAGQATASLWNIDDNRQIDAVTMDSSTQDVIVMGDGLQVILEGSVQRFTRFEVVANGAGPLVPSEQGCLAFNSSGFPLLNGSDRPSEAQQVGPAEWGIHTGGVSSDFSYETRFVPRTMRTSPYSGTSNWDRVTTYDFEIRFTGSSGKAYMGFTNFLVVDVPFELWNIGIGTPNDPSDDFRMIPWVNDADGDGVFNLTAIDHSISGGDNDPMTDWIYWMEPDPRAPGTAGYDAFANDPNYDAGGATTGTGDEAMARMVLINWNGGSVIDPSWPANVNQLMPEQGTVFRITTAKAASPRDVYRFIVPPLVDGPDVVAASSQRVGVYPNPYIAGWSYSDEVPNQFVTFNNLPEQAIIRIFDLGGRLVRTLQKDNGSQFMIWNLRNEMNQPVASGIYVCYVEMPEIGHTKILKLAIVQAKVF
jgi:hypothetical protein